MTALEKAYQMAFDGNIRVDNFHFSETRKGACLANGDLTAILLDKPRIQSAAEEQEILTEEITHFQTGNLYFINATSNTPLGRENRRICEARTRAACIEEMLPPERIQEAIDNEGPEVWQIAEYCGRTVEFTREACEHYAETGRVFLEKFKDC